MLFFVFLLGEVDPSLGETASCSPLGDCEIRVALVVLGNVVELGFGGWVG